ncbi:hypothetical protein [Microvirga terrestris]|uniref:Uncharacterized protein n=1 Tax=Microvirga terrestris TaxID=2791024 RepID=A0ABS0HNU1_9HYPH|nr:hypothetical protein [Microvirga terrestris]MBF9194941.1 hypothetical protein [Microvirga terrestris]
MTKEDLAQKLDHMDPGATFMVPEDTLAQMFGEVTLSYDSHEPLSYIADFALEHRCTFSFHEHEGAVPCFKKDDVF